MDTDVVQRWTRSPVTMLTGVLAVVYGLGVAFGDSVGLTGGALQTWMWVGAVVIGVLFVASLITAARRPPTRA